MFSWSFNIKLSKINRINRQKVEDTVDLKSTMNQFNIKIYTVFTQQQGTNSVQVPVYYKPGETETSRDKKQGAKISLSKDTEIIQSLFS